MGTASSPSLDSQSKSSWFSPPLWMAVGAGFCALFAVMELAGPERAPRVFWLIRWGAIGATALGWGLFASRKFLSAWIAPVSLVVGGGLLAIVLGVAPELLDVPTGGVGDRMWGIPTIIGVPIAGVALLFPSCPRIVAASALALALVGLVQPIAPLGEIQLAIQHHWTHIHNTGSLCTLLITMVVLLSLAGLWFGAHNPDSILPRVCGVLCCVALPAWEIVRWVGTTQTEQTDGGSTAVGSLLLLVGCLCWLAAGLSQWNHEPSPQHRWTARTVEALVMLLCIGLWLLLKSFSWRWSVTDENIYFYDAMLLVRGELPYRDFFFAHPPLHLAVPAGIFGIFGFHLTLAKLIPVVAALLTGLLIWKLVRDALGRLAALFTLGVFLFAFELLQASTNLNGVNLTSLWLTGALFLAIRHRWLMAGALLGCAVCTGVYAIAGALALIVLAFFHKLRSGTHILLGFVAVAGSINLLCWLVAGDDYIGGVYRFHGLKMAQNTAPVFLKMLHYHPHLALGLMLAPVLLVWQLYCRFPLLGEKPLHERRGSVFSPRKLWEEPGPGLVKIAFLLSIALLVEFCLFQELYDFYFALIFPALAICTGYTVAALLSTGVHELRAIVAGRVTGGLAVLAGVMVLWAGQVPIQQETMWTFGARGWPKELRTEKTRVRAPRSGGVIVSRYHEVRKEPPNDPRDPSTRPVRGKGANSEYLDAGTVRQYPWIESAVWPSAFDPIVRALFWRGQRVKWNTSPGYRRYLWQKSRYVSVADDVGEFVEEHSSSNETIAGNSSIAPMVALLADRRIAANIVDTNGKRFMKKEDPRFTGPNALEHGAEILTLEDYFGAICQDNIRFLVGSRSGYLSNRRLASLPIVQTYFEPVAHFPDPWAKFRTANRPDWNIRLWRLRDQYAEQSPRCQWIAP